MHVRVGIVIFVLIGFFLLIAGIFWSQEIRYLLPTPVPPHYKVVLPGDVIKYDSIVTRQLYSKPKLLHFFNPDCPCSRFNITHFQTLQKNYADKVEFFVVVTSQEKVAGAKRLIDSDITIIVDSTETLATACGVYSTPQAALIQSSNQLYFRGNYNKSRYCTDQNSNFVQMALDSMISFKKPPHFNELATRSYGCSISISENTIGNL